LIAYGDDTTPIGGANQGQSLFLHFLRPLLWFPTNQFLSDRGNKEIDIARDYVGLSTIKSGLRWYSKQWSYSCPAHILGRFGDMTLIIGSLVTLVRWSQKAEAS
jgi:hypothetical protein